MGDERPTLRPPGRLDVLLGALASLVLVVLTVACVEVGFTIFALILFGALGYHISIYR